MMVTAEEVESRLGWVVGTVQFQQANGLVTEAQAMAIVAKINDAESKLSTNPPDLPGAIHAARDARVLLLGAINSPDNTAMAKFLFLYGGHAWIVIVGAALVLIALLLKGVTNFSVLTLESGQSTVTISADVVAWGGLGGCAFAIYYLRQTIYEMQLSKFYALYYMVYPLAGSVFGLAIVVLIAGGLLAVEAAPGYALFAGAAFLAGMLQEWAVKTFRDVAEAIHPTV